MKSEQQNAKKLVLDQVEKELDALAKKNTPELELNDIKKIIKPLDVDEVTATGGSTIRFFHKSLLGIKQYTGGYFTIHRVHGGGTKIRVRRNDYKKMLLPTLLLIIDNLRQTLK